MTKSIVTPQNLIRSKQRKGIFYFSQKDCYSKHIKTDKNPKMVKHVVILDFLASFEKEKSPETFYVSRDFPWLRQRGDLNPNKSQKSPYFSMLSAIIHQSFTKLFSYHKALFNTKPKKAKSSFLGFFILNYIIFNISYKQTTSVFYFNAYMVCSFI